MGVIALKLCHRLRLELIITKVAAVMPPACHTMPDAALLMVILAARSRCFVAGVLYFISSLYVYSAI